MAPARRRVVYVVARNLIVLFVCGLPVGGGDYVPARRLRGARACIFQVPGVVHWYDGRRTRRSSYGSLRTPQFIPSTHPCRSLWQSSKARCRSALSQRCMHKHDLRRSAVVSMADETKSSSDGSPPEPKSLLGLESEGRPEMITVEAEPEIVSPRVTRASLPPVALENGALECPVRPRVRFRPRGHRKLTAAMEDNKRASSQP